MLLEFINIYSSLNQYNIHKFNNTDWDYDNMYLPEYTFCNKK